MDVEFIVLGTTFVSGQVKEKLRGLINCDGRVLRKHIYMVNVYLIESEIEGDQLQELSSALGQLTTQLAHHAFMYATGLGVLGVPEEHEGVHAALDDLLQEGAAHHLHDTVDNGLSWNRLGTEELCDIARTEPLDEGADRDGVDLSLIVEELLELELAEVGAGDDDAGRDRSGVEIKLGKQVGVRFEVRVREDEPFVL